MKHSFSYQNHCWKQRILLVKQLDYWALISPILSSNFLPDKFLKYHIAQLSKAYNITVLCDFPDVSLKLCWHWFSLFLTYRLLLSSICQVNQTEELKDLTLSYCFLSSTVSEVAISLILQSRFYIFDPSLWIFISTRSMIVTLI